MWSKIWKVLGVVLIASMLFVGTVSANGQEVCAQSGDWSSHQNPPLVDVGAVEYCVKGGSDNSPNGYLEYGTYEEVLAVINTEGNAELSHWSYRMGEQEPNYWMKAEVKVDCDGWKLYLYVMDGDTVVVSGTGTSGTWVDLTTVEYSPLLTFIAYNAGEPYGTLTAEDVQPVAEPQDCVKDRYALDITHCWEMIDGVLTFEITVTNTGNTKAYFKLKHVDTAGNIDDNDWEGWLDVGQSAKFSTAKVGNFKVKYSTTGIFGQFEWLDKNNKYYTTSLEDILEYPQCGKDEGCVEKWTGRWMITYQREGRGHWVTWCNLYVPHVADANGDGRVDAKEAKAWKWSNLYIAEQCSLDCEPQTWEGNYLYVKKEMKTCDGTLKAGNHYEYNEETFCNYFDYCATLDTVE